MFFSHGLSFTSSLIICSCIFSAAVGLSVVFKGLLYHSMNLVLVQESSTHVCNVALVKYLNFNVFKYTLVFTTCI